MFRRKVYTLFAVLVAILFFGNNDLAAREVFEKGDAIYRELDIPFLEYFGHAGVYRYWKDIDNVPDIDDLEKHLTIESLKQKGGVKEANFKEFYEASPFWHVCTKNDLTYSQRQIIVDTAEEQIDCKYRFLWGYKSPERRTFRCDGLVEYCYEQAGVDIIPGDTWSPLVALLPGRTLLYPRRQMEALEVRYTAELEEVNLGKKDEYGNVIYGPLYIGEEPAYFDGTKYFVNGTCDIKSYASDGDKGSGVTRLELWFGEQDDTPEEFPGKMIWFDPTDYEKKHDYIYSWDTTPFEPGEYTLYANAFDQAGNTKTSDGIQVVVGVKFIVDAPDEVIIGSPFNVIITTYKGCEGGWEIYTDYDGTCNLTEDWDGTIDPTLATGFVNGIKVVSITATGGTAGIMRLIATDSENSNMTGFDDINLVYVMEDTHVWWYDPNENYGQENWFGIISSGFHINDIRRMYIKTPFHDGQNKILHLYCQHAKNHDPTNTMPWKPFGVYSIDSDAWGEYTITWDNQPALGVLLDTKTVNAVGWWTFNIGSAESVCIKLFDESTLQPYTIQQQFKSRECWDATKRPYITEGP